MTHTLVDLIRQAAERDPDGTAIKHKTDSMTYEALMAAIDNVAAGFIRLGLRKSDRVAVFAGKQPETVIAAFGATRAGGVFVPVNPLLKPNQAAYIFGDCDVRQLVTTPERLQELAPVLHECGALRRVVVTGNCETERLSQGPEIIAWPDLLESCGRVAWPEVSGSEMAALMYTSGSTGKPKGVILSHANMTIGANSVNQYLKNSANDRILAVLPFSFDAGFSQLTTGFSAGACVVLHDYLLPQDVVRIVKRERITGITGVPPLWMQLADQAWPEQTGHNLRYFANTGGKMPRKTLARLREIFPNAKPFLMYGLTEAFRSTYLPPEQVDKRPDSIGVAIPNVEVVVVSEKGTLCQPGETGELVHTGPLVSMGYWNDPERTSERFRKAPGQPSSNSDSEVAVWSGDTVRMDDEGYLYFVGRKDDMIKTSGYRVSPTEIEEVAYSTGLVTEVAALGVPHDRLGQGIVLVAKAKHQEATPTCDLLEKIQRQLPTYMVPHAVRWKNSLPRNANGKLDRNKMAAEFQDIFEDRKDS
jgi:acyl-CoA ligase (AMP-forming) (exosortase A-associated)